MVNPRFGKKVLHRVSHYITNSDNCELKNIIKIKRPRIALFKLFNSRPSFDNNIKFTSFLMIFEIQS